MLLNIAFLISLIIVIIVSLYFSIVVAISLNMFYLIKFFRKLFG